MKRFTARLMLLTALLSSCDPITDKEAEAKPEQEEKEVLSTLEGDKEVISDIAQAYADNFGDWYGTGYCMWGIYLQAYDTREQIYIELLNSTYELTVPTGEYTVSEELRENSIIPGIIAEEEGEMLKTYSWYIQIDPSSSAIPIYLNQAPVTGGTLTITETDEECFRLVFDLNDDAGNRIYGSYEGGVVVEDFRM